ncbi:MAG: hypothetical protein SNI83_07445 [Rikenellaceae bacterium]
MSDIADKLMMRGGASSLTDKELLELLLEDMPKAAMCVEELYNKCGGSLQKIGSEDIARLRMVAGIGLKRAQRIVVAMELGRRAACDHAAELTVISSNRDVADFFRSKLESLNHEECWILYLTASNSIIGGF